MQYFRDDLRNFHFMLFFLLVYSLFSLYKRRVKKKKMSDQSKVTSCTRESWVMILWPTILGTL